MPKKNSPGQMGPFGPKNSTSSKLWISSKKILKIYRMKGAIRYVKNLLVGFRESNSFGVI